MTAQEYYERTCELLDRQLEQGRITKAEHLEKTRELRRELQAELREAGQRTN